MDAVPDRLPQNGYPIIIVIVIIIRLNLRSSGVTGR